MNLHLSSGLYYSIDVEDFDILESTDTNLCQMVRETGVHSQVAHTKEIKNGTWCVLA